jgi:hypothetical protein
VLLCYYLSELRKSQMVRFYLVLLLLSLIGFAQAHHGAAQSYDVDTLITIEGEILSISWRNPHVTMELQRTVETGGTEVWEIEASTANRLERIGISQDVVSVGSKVAFTGAPSRHGLNALAAWIMTLEDGLEVPIWPQRAIRMGRIVNRVPVDTAIVEASTANANGIFRVWSRPDISGQLLEGGYLPFTEEALLAREGWDSLVDDLVLRCIPRGMPSIMNNPQPMEFIDNGSSIVLRLEEWDAERVIYLDQAAPPTDESDSGLGYSIGRWEDNTLVVNTTHINDPYFDDIGTPQGDFSAVEERFTLGEDETRLDYESVHVDSDTFTEPARQTGYWNWLPGEQVKPYNCTVN